MNTRKLTHTQIPMGKCEVIVYAGEKTRRNIVYRQTVQFDNQILSKGIRGIISSEDLLAYKQNTIREYISDVELTISGNTLINPMIFVAFDSYVDEETEVSIDDVFNEISLTEKDTDADILKEKLNKYFGE